MKKYLLLPVMAFVLCLVACSSDSDDAPNEEKKSFEEKKYWMDTMKEISQKIDKKTFWAWVIGIGSVAGVAVGTVLYALSHKK